MKQNSEELLNQWVYYQGAGQVQVDGVDSMHFLDLCSDLVIRAGIKTEAKVFDGVTLFC